LIRRCKIENSAKSLPQEEKKESLSNQKAEKAIDSYSVIRIAEHLVHFQEVGKLCKQAHHALESREPPYGDSTTSETSPCFEFFFTKCQLVIDEQAVIE
jgi:hypothetical protein